MQQNKIPIQSFFETQFVDYSSYSNLRMIASAIDGMKNTQRKIVRTVKDKNISDEIKVSQLDSKMAEYCVTGDTLVNTVEYGKITIEKLTTLNPSNFHVWCLDSNGKKTIGEGCHPRITKQVYEYIEIETDNSVLKCTLDHLILVNRNNKNIWVEAGLLNKNDIIVNI